MDRESLPIDPRDVNLRVCSYGRNGLPNVAGQNKFTLFFLLTKFLLTKFNLLYIPEHDSNLVPSLLIYGGPNMADSKDSGVVILCALL